MINTPSFYSRNGQGHIDAWPESDAPDTEISEQNKQGRRRAGELISIMRSEGNHLLLGNVVKEITRKGVYGPLEVGFYARIAEDIVDGDLGDDYSESEDLDRKPHLQLVGG